jgi:polyferredoxin
MQSNSLVLPNKQQQNQNKIYEIDKRNGPKQQKYIEVIRKKAERAALKGFTCAECMKFYEAMEQQGK